VIRYFAIASAIVFACIFALLALGPMQQHAAEPGPYASTIAPAGSPRAEGDAQTSPSPVAGDAPWALSALPECFDERRHVAGPRAYLSRQFGMLPMRAWKPVASGALVSADCRIVVDGAAGSIDVARGDTHLRVPPVTRVFVAGERIVVERVLSAGRYDVRVYALRSGSAPVFAAR
jgi:hypothetical protein